MSMGCGANYCYVLAQDKLAEIVGPEKLARLQFAMEAADESAQDIANEEAENPELLEAYRDVVDTFNTATGLELYLRYHDSENNGDRYDEVDGQYWALEGVTQYTPAAEKLRDSIQECLYVTYC